MTPLIIDSFAGGGGASTGIEAATGRPVDIAINHWGDAITMHRANHPSTHHYLSDIHAVDPREACRGRPVRLFWASPDCKHFSRAKGGTPREQGIRDLAWVVVRWAEAVRPAIICLENVPEFETWGPLREDGSPCPDSRGLTFRAWIKALRDLGYSVEWRALVAADYGAPTTRKRLYLIARCDGLPIIWPEPTHGKGRALPWRTAAEIIDWSLPCPSIFSRRKPLAEATMRRIATGVRRYVIESREPYVVRGAAAALIQTSYGERKGQAPRVLDLHEPLGTVVAGGQKHGLVMAFLAKHYGGVVGSPLDAALGTVTSKDHHALVTSHLLKLYGTSTGADVREPLPTVTAGGSHLGEVRAFLVKYYGAGGAAQGQSLFEPLGTVTTHDRFGLVMVHGEPHVIVDIGMRMLQPRELFRAQGFPDSYDIGEGRLTKTSQIALAGNSVCPPVAEAIVRAQLGASERRAAA